MPPSLSFEVVEADFDLRVLTAYANDPRTTPSTVATPNVTCSVLSVQSISSSRLYAVGATKLMDSSVRVLVAKYTVSRVSGFSP